MFEKFTLAIIFKVIILCLFMLFLHLSSFLLSRIFCLGVFILTLNKFFQIADLFLPLHFMGLCFFYKLAFNFCIVIFACRGPPKELRNSLLTLRIFVFS